MLPGAEEEEARAMREVEEEDDEEVFDLRKAVQVSMYSTAR